MDLLLGPLLIFCLRICDVSIGTLRTLYMVRGDRLRAVPLAFFESGIWVFAISRIMKELNNPANMVAYAAGFAAGTFFGITLEKWIASGWIMMRLISRAGSHAVVDALRAAGFGVTAVMGEGLGGEQAILFVVTHRRRGPEVLQLVKGIDPQAFVTIDPVSQAVGGYLKLSPGASGVRK